MPTISVIREELYEAIGKTYTDEQFDELCFEFGIELDDIVREPSASGEVVTYKIEIPANRYDLLCTEGLSMALRVFLELQDAPVFRTVEPAGGRLRMTVRSSTYPLRPYVGCAVLRGVTFNKQRYDSFIALQEKLHQNICRRRTLVAIGTHDLSTLSPQFTYECRAPDAINFVPLTETERSFSGKALMDHYREDPLCKHLKPYTDIIYDAPAYPLITDSNGTVLSLPPIINSNHSKITMATRDVFIECTGTDLTKVNIVLDTMVTMFSQYCEQPFTVEPVEVHYERDGKVEITPRLSSRRETAKLSDVRGIVGVPLTGEDVCRLCTRMQLGPAEYLPEDAEGSAPGGVVVVNVPPTRSDILHAVDIIEDVAIAYGFNKVPTRMPATLSVGGPLPINHFSDLLRDEIGRAGYVEMLTHGLCSRQENFGMLRLPEGPAVSLANPANVEYQVVRTTLLPGALKTLNYNRSMSFAAGVKLFEISDVVIPCDNDVGCKNVRRLLALYAGPSAGFEVVHGLVDRIMTLAQIAPDRAYAGASLSAEQYEAINRIALKNMCYTIAPGSSPTFFPGRAAELRLLAKDGSHQVIGQFGILHPEVLASFDIPYPCSVIEMDLEPIM